MSMQPPTSRFLHQLETNLQHFRPNRDQVLELHFLNCKIDLPDVEGLHTTLTSLTLQPQQSIHFSFNCCRLGCQETLKALKDLFSGHNQVTSLNFSLTDFHFHETLGLVTSCNARLLYLKLSLRYQQGTLAPLLEQCPHLETLKLDARFPLEHRVRLVCVQELVTALLPLKQLKVFELASCELEDEVFALLTGGLLALKETLVDVHLQTEGGNGPGLTWQSLPLMAHYLTEMELSDLDLEIQECRKLLHGAPMEVLKGFTHALQDCTKGLSVRLAWNNVGWDEESALSVLEAAAYNTSADDMSLEIQDFDFVETERFVYHLATVAPSLNTMVDLRLVDTTSATAGVDPIDNNSGHKHHNHFHIPHIPHTRKKEKDKPVVQKDFSWWNEEQLELLVEALSKNASLQTFEFTIGDHTLDANESHQVRTTLKRNHDIALVNEYLDSLDQCNNAPQHGKWALALSAALLPQILTKVGNNVNPMYLLVRCQVPPWLEPHNTGG